MKNELTNEMTNATQQPVRDSAYFARLSELSKLNAWILDYVCTDSPVQRGDVLDYIAKRLKEIGESK